ncbi:MAG: dephospho-CoA kinase [Bacteroidales bacterium]|jgi:dephospho-CoA kinase|nr:dephospho-CoA kinase [Bacteroidales bacterium]
MIRVGVTGGIGSGKTTVCSLFRALDIPVYHADDEAKRILTTDPGTASRIRQLTGGEPWNIDGSPDHAALARKIFADPSLLTQINQIIHPAVHRNFDRWCKQQSDVPYLIMEAAILFETGGYKRMDKTILVIAPEELRIHRVTGRDGRSASSVMERIANQWPDEQKKPLADYLILNDGNELLLPQVTHIDQKLKELISTHQ